MCLLKVEGPALKTTGLGWKVFRVNENGEVYPGNRGYQVYAYGRWYSARTFWLSGTSVIFTEALDAEAKTYPRFTYKNGFHVALRRDDARAFIKRVKASYPGDKYVIRQVEFRQAHTLGQGNPNYFGGPQVIADEIKILKPRPGGSAYARKRAAVVPAPTA